MGIESTNHCIAAEILRKQKILFTNKDCVMSILGHMCLLKKNKKQKQKQMFHKFIALVKNLCSTSVSSHVHYFLSYPKSVIQNFPTLLTLLTSPFQTDLWTASSPLAVFICSISPQALNVLRPVFLDHHNSKQVLSKGKCQKPNEQLSALILASRQ